MVWENSLRHRETRWSNFFESLVIKSILSMRVSIFTRPNAQIPPSIFTRDSMPFIRAISIYISVSWRKDFNSNKLCCNVKFYFRNKWLRLYIPQFRTFMHDSIFNCDILFSSQTNIYWFIHSWMVIKNHININVAQFLVLKCFMNLIYTFAQKNKKECQYFKWIKWKVIFFHFIL